MTFYVSLSALYIDMILYIAYLTSIWRQNFYILHPSFDNDEVLWDSRFQECNRKPSSHFSPPVNDISQKRLFHTVTGIFHERFVNVFTAPPLVYSLCRSQQYYLHSHDTGFHIYFIYRSWCQYFTIRQVDTLSRRQAINCIFASRLLNGILLSITSPFDAFMSLSSRAFILSKIGCHNDEMREAVVFRHRHR